MIAVRDNSPVRRNRIPMWVLAVLGVYSVTLLAIEATTSQDYLRHYVTDITGEVQFYAVNTTLSVSFLWGTALLFSVAANLPPRFIGDTGRWWFWSQAAVFFCLGCDDRFGLHELFSRQLRIGDHYVLLSAAFVEISLLAYSWRQQWIPIAARSCLKMAALLFAAMWMIDGYAPHNMAMRLSIEDLCKAWSCFYFARYAWVMLFSHLNETVDEWSGDSDDWHNILLARQTAEPAEVVG